MQLAASTALVTGAGGGSGQVIARELAARDAKVIVTGRRSGAPPVRLTSRPDM